MPVRGIWGSTVAVVVAAALVGCASASTPDAAPTGSPTAAVTLAAVIDGDTVETSAGTVRIIGIDAPERGECGYDAAAAIIGALLTPGDPITLVLPEGQNPEDRHGRLVRYVDTVDGVDVGSAVLAAGLAVARYDSADGYPAHPRETDYHAAQLATLSTDGFVTTVDCGAEAVAAEQARIAAEEAAADVPVAPPVAAIDEWWRQYSSCTKLKKNADGHPVGPFSRDNPAEAAIYDWFANGTGNNGDGEGDGLACE